MFKRILVNSGLHTWVHLPPACRMDVLILLQWWHGHTLLSMTPPFYVSWSRRGHLDHADSSDSKARSYTRLVCRNPELWWHAPLAWWWETQNTSPFMCVSECQMDWSSKAPDQKRSIPLGCELGLLERRFVKLEGDEDYGEALQACARARMSGA